MLLVAKGKFPTHQPLDFKLLGYMQLLHVPSSLKSSSHIKQLHH